MKKLARLLIAVAPVLGAACADANPTAPQPSAQLAEMNDGGALGVSVMTRNLYLGFDADPVIAALAGGDPAAIGPAMQTAVATLYATDFAARAGAIAEEIERTRPHAAGLQEAWAIHADLTPFGISQRIDLDYIDILQSALRARRLPYRVVARVIDTDMQPLPGVELMDREALLVDTSRVTVTAIVAAQTYANNIGVIAPGIDKKAGYIVARTRIRGQAVTFASTHLESDLGPGSHDLVAQLRAAQAMELAAATADAGTVVLVGDMNDEPGSLMYQVYAGAGLVDTWAALHPRQPGLTDTCFSPDLSDGAPHCQQRHDFVFERGLDQPRAGLLGDDFLVGLSRAERVRGPAGLIWPSDHAGVVGDYLVPPARGLR